VEPGKEAFDLPAPLGAAERPAILGAAAAATGWRRSSRSGLDPIPWTV